MPERLAAQALAATWQVLIEQLISGEAPAPSDPSTPLSHEQRRLRQLLREAR